MPFPPKHILALVFLCLVTSWSAMAQNASNLRERWVVMDQDTITLDTLSIVPDSWVLIAANGSELDSSAVEFDWANGSLIRKKEISDSIKVRYRVLPFLLTEESKNKDRGLLAPSIPGSVNPFENVYSPTRPEDIFRFSGLERSGSISRGIQVGNNQDLGVSSSLNLQLSGKLTPKLGVRASISDNNIPVQPQGNTQNLQEFDQVYIQLYTDRTELTAGDFRLERPDSYFLSFFKRAQGLSAKHTFPLRNNKKEDLNPGTLMMTASGALSRGKFARQIIQGVEGNQGPYRLRGAENELFIIVLAGTERVYIDGQLKVRGQEHDYVIDYNTGEITFTAKQLITKDRRIIVEFQYSDRNYTRSLVHAGAEYHKNKLKVKFNFFSEQDSKNQPVNIDLGGGRRGILESIGDSIQNALLPSVDTVQFDADEVLYSSFDTIVNIQGSAVLFTEIFKYSIDPDSARFRVSFSDVGEGNGMYNQVVSVANGRVFDWIAPDSLTGERRGRYEPVLQVVTPKRNQLITLGAEYEFSKNSRLWVEGALSNNDLNLFSDVNDNDNIGFAGRVKYDQDIPLDTGRNWLINTGVDFEHTNGNFRPIERFRSVEFERDWSNSSDVNRDQYISMAYLGFTKKELGTIRYEFRSFVNDQTFTAWQHALNGIIDKGGFHLDVKSSYINSAGQINDNRFARWIVNAKQELKFLVIGGRSEFEDNVFKVAGTDSLLLSSYHFNDMDFFIGSPTKWKNGYRINYRRREDKLPSNNQLLRSTQADEFGLTISLLKNKKVTVKTNSTFRQLKIIRTNLSSQTPDNTLINRLEIGVKLWKGLLVTQSFYEVGSGLESEKTVTFLEVNPGQGGWNWIDQNNNGIRETNEFVQAVYQDTAKYIQVLSPTNEFEKVYTTQLNQLINIRPRALWANKKGFLKFLSRISNQFAFRVDRKTRRTNLALAFDPLFTKVDDTTLVSLTSSLRNTVSFNQGYSKYGFDYTYQDNRNKAFLANGFSARSTGFHQIRARWNIIKPLTLNGEYEIGKETTTTALNINNFEVDYYELQPNLVIQPGTKFRITLLYNYAEKKNNLSESLGEQAIIREAGLEAKYNLKQRGSLEANFSFLSIDYTGTEGNTIEFQMLDGLKAGLNYTWGALFQTRIAKNLQLNLNYSGRKSADNKPIHTGNVQLRAFF